MILIVFHININLKKYMSSLNLKNNTRRRAFIKLLSLLLFLLLIRLGTCLLFKALIGLIIILQHLYQPYMFSCSSKIPNVVSSCELQTKNQMSNPAEIWYQNEARNKTSSIQATISCSVLTDRRPTTLKTSFDTNRYFVLSSRNQCSANMAELALKQLNFLRLLCPALCLILTIYISCSFWMIFSSIV